MRNVENGMSTLCVPFATKWSIAPCMRIETNQSANIWKALGSPRHWCEFKGLLLLQPSDKSAALSSGMLVGDFSLETLSRIVLEEQE